MPLCSACKSEAVTQTLESRGFLKAPEWVTHGGERIESTPPHGMEWGESCERCPNKAAVEVDA